MKRNYVAATVCPTCGALQRVSAKDLGTFNVPSGEPGHILAVISEYFNIDLVLVLSKEKAKDVVDVRHIVLYFTRLRTRMSYPRIGRTFGMDQSSVQHAVKRISQRVDEEEWLAEDIAALRKLLSED